MTRAKAKEIIIQERHIQALGLAKKGKSYRVIGAELDISHEQARQDVKKALGELKAVEAGEAEELRLLELSRLDSISEAYWDKAIKGDTGAAYLVLKVSESRRKLVGIDAPTKIAPTDPTGEREFEGLNDSQRANMLTGYLETALARAAAASTSTEAPAGTELDETGQPIEWVKENDFPG